MPDRPISIITYNIHLRDDKTYVSLRLDPRETFPTLTVRNNFV